MLKLERKMMRKQHLATLKSVREQERRPTSAFAERKTLMIMKYFSKKEHAKMELEKPQR